MPSLKYHIHRHSKNVIKHFQKHHRKYVIGIVGGAITVKLFLAILTSLGLYSTFNTYAQDESGSIDQEIITVQDETGSIDTGNVEDSTGDVEQDTGSIEDSTGSVDTGTVEDSTGDIEQDTGSIEDNTGSVDTGSEEDGFTETPQVVCNSLNFNFFNPLSGYKLKGNTTFSWTYNNSDCSGKIFTIQLLDHNDQRINIGTSSVVNTWFNFDTNKLYSGFYNITGLNSSGNSEVIYTGEYPGINSKYYNAYKIRFVESNQNVDYVSDYFTIDNQKPSVTGTLLSAPNAIGEFIGFSGLVNLSFTASEELTGIQIKIQGTNANFINTSGLQYNYSMILNNLNSGGLISYTISYSDLAGNTGYYNGVSNINYDNITPTLKSLIFDGTFSGLLIKRENTDDAIYQFKYNLTGNENIITLNNNSQYQSGNFINLSTGLISTGIYNFNLKLTDIVDNRVNIAGKFYFDSNGIVQFKNYITSYSNMDSILSTGNLNFSDIIQNEVSKFNDCKDGVKTNKINIKLNDLDIQLNMPNFEKTYIRKIVNAFTVVIMDKLEKVDLAKEELDNVIKRFDDFLIILKLVRDDENQCKQNLSNYHTRLFKKTIEDYDMSL